MLPVVVDIGLGQNIHIVIGFRFDDLIVIVAVNGFGRVFGKNEIRGSGHGYRDVVDCFYTVFIVSLRDTLPWIGG